MGNAYNPGALGASLDQEQVRESMRDIRPVFRGLADAGVSGKEIARILEVAPSTISKWRRGALEPGGDVVQFLTLMLADLIQAKERTLDAMGDVPIAWRLGRESELAAMRQALATQEQMNRTLPAVDIRDGARRFKNWLEGSVVPITGPSASPPQRFRITA